MTLPSPASPPPSRASRHLLRGRPRVASPAPRRVRPVAARGSARPRVGQSARATALLTARGAPRSGRAHAQAPAADPLARAVARPWAPRVSHGWARRTAYQLRLGTRGEGKPFPVISALDGSRDPGHVPEVHEVR